MVRLRAVALIVTHPYTDQILTLRELESKPHLGKFADMRSIPMETMHDGETHRHAVHRLIREELAGMPVRSVHVRKDRIGVYRVVPHVWVSLFTALSDTNDLSCIVGADGVDTHAWVHAEEALGLWLRQGAAEMIGDHLNNKTGVIRRHCIAPSQWRDAHH